MNTPVSFEIAKLLKEKGFEQRTKSYTEDGRFVTVSLTIRRFNPEKIYYPAPTIAEVIMWLYEKHEIWISVDWMTRTNPYNSGFYCHLRGTNKSLNQDNFIVINDTLDPGYEIFNSPTEAYEVTILYTLNNLI